MKIYEVSDKKKYLDLLLIGDEQESMIYRYLDGGIMFVLDDGGIKGEAVVCDTGGGVAEIKNIAVLPEYRKCGYGKALIEFVCERYKKDFSVLRAGTGESSLTVPFYEKCGFTRAHTVKNFFTDNYDYPIIEGVVRLTDMVYFEKRLKL